jgi:hypothetical protein
VWVTSHVRPRQCLRRSANSSGGSHAFSQPLWPYRIKTGEPPRNAACLDPRSRTDMLLLGVLFRLAAPICRTVGRVLK